MTFNEWMITAIVSLSVAVLVIMFVFLYRRGFGEEIKERRKKGKK